ncbi:unnamed protein product [Musa acuminata subsp. malaccensis]|uniref:(wild Malaysian banana) hypothetical protein n=1 Tax=Musa acuminata subsp. malaccensis TaxID=214687 RepID=A0A804HM15_MUSAM|nr:unnamed protein product [Musa acuminata subsp. malaccensis]
MTSRTRTQEVSTSTPLIEDQIRNYRRNQRRIFNARRRLGQLISRNPDSNIQVLEQQIDPQAQLQLSMRERAAIAPAEILYHSRRDDESVELSNSQRDHSLDSGATPTACLSFIVVNLAHLSQHMD